MRHKKYDKILSLLHQGKTEKEIAVETGYTYLTVRTYINGMRSLGIDIPYKLNPWTDEQVNWLKNNLDANINVKMRFLNTHSRRSISTKTSHLRKAANEIR